MFTQFKHNVKFTQSHKIKLMEKWNGLCVFKETLEDFIDSD